MKRNVLHSLYSIKNIINVSSFFFYKINNIFCIPYIYVFFNLLNFLSQFQPGVTSTPMMSNLLNVGGLPSSLSSRRQNSSTASNAALPPQRTAPLSTRLDKELFLPFLNSTMFLSCAKDFYSFLFNSARDYFTPKLYFHVRVGIEL
jgi:hypothetical protein